MTTPHESSISLAERLGALACVGTIAQREHLSDGLVALTIAVPDSSIAGVPGNDVMVRLPHGDTAVRRRYSVRSHTDETVTLWISTRHEGPGAAWATSAPIGSAVDLVGPRGKIVLDPMADWHLFVGDTSALGAFYRLADSIESPGRAIFIIEVDDPQDSITTSFDEGLGVTGIFVDRQDRADNDATGLLRGLSALAWPDDEGHAYLFGEFSVMKSVAVALRDRGLDGDAISQKAFWRGGRANQEHGEPDKNEA
jgi:NADPH-dependent ferric siderophore reductase